MSSARRTARLARHDLGDEAGLGLQCLPHVGVERSLGDVAVDRHFRVLVALAEDAALPLLDLGGFPRGVKVMQGDQAFLDVGAGAHLLRAADQHAHRAASDFLEQGLFLGVGIGVADGGDLRPGDAACCQLGRDLVIDRIPPRGRIHAHVAEDHLRAASRRRTFPDGRDLVHQGVDLRAGEIRRRA